jgi:hypothetical protein
MEVRYLGFEQQQNSRTYRFEVIEKGQVPRRFVVIADLALFLANHVGIQEGPTLCANKLTADLEKNFDGAHELTGDDLRSHADARILAEAHRAEMRKGTRRRPTPSPSTGPGEERSPWRNFGLAKPPESVWKA